MLLPVDPLLGLAGAPEHRELVGHLAETQLSIHREYAPVVAPGPKMSGDVSRHCNAVTSDEHALRGFTIQENVWVLRAKGWSTLEANTQYVDLFVVPLHALDQLFRHVLIQEEADLHPRPALVVARTTSSCVSWRARGSPLPRECAPA